MFKYFPFMSLILLGFLFFMSSTHLWAGTMIFIVQILSMGIVYWLIKKLKQKDLQFLVPIMKQFMGFFAFAFTIWLVLAVFGHAASVIGRSYSIGAIIVFIGLNMSLTHQIFVGSDLLASYIKKNEKEKGGKDEYGKRNK